MSKHDIQTAADIDILVRDFYQSVLEDPIIGFFFTDIAHIKLEQHLPTIAQFWQKQLLGTGQYQGRTFEIHRNLHYQAEMTEHHFHRWLHLFKTSVDRVFSGERAELAKQRATAIAKSMLQGLQDRHMETVLRQREELGVQFFEPPP